MSDTKKEKAPRNQKLIVAMILVVIVALMFGLGLLVRFFVPQNTPIEESKIFNAEDVEVKCLAVVFALNMEDYEALQKDYADETMKEFLTKEKMDSAKESLDVDWKEKVSFGDATIVETKQAGKTYAVAQLPVTYGDKVVTYTLTFDADYKLAGLYMK